MSAEACPHCGADRGEARRHAGRIVGEARELKTHGIHELDVTPGDLDELINHAQLILVALPAIDAAPGPDSDDDDDDDSEGGRQ